MAMILSYDETPLNFFDNKNKKLVHSQTYSGMIEKLEILRKEFEPEKKIEEKPASKVEEVLALAEKERLEGGTDLKEPKGDNYGPQVKKYLSFVGLTEGNPWCAAWVTWVLNKSDVPFVKTADTWQFKTWAEGNNILYSNIVQPERGDVFLQIGEDGNPAHTGFVEGINPDGKGNLLTIEGNIHDGIRHKNDMPIKNCKFIKWQKLT